MNTSPWQLRPRGFTMIEIIIAMGLVLVGIFAVVKINPAGYRSAELSKNHLTALRLARSVIDEVRSRPFGASVSDLQGKTYLARGIPTDPSSGERVETDPSQPGSPRKSEQTFTLSDVAVSSASSSAQTGVVSVTVRWTEGTDDHSTGATKTISLQGGLCREP
jgi:prepilin-type N-terminal cleavage/methylation domain-containing protein